MTYRLSNRHAVDRLAHLRAEIKSLQEQEVELKSRIIGSVSEELMLGESQTVEGDEFVASVSFSERDTVDRKVVEKLLGKKFPQCLKTSQSITVRIAPRHNREEI